MRLIWHGTAAIELVSGSGRILFDPFVPLSGSQVPVELKDFDGFTDIFITHGHTDHISDLPRIIERNPGARVYCTKTPFETLIGKGLDGKNLVLLNYGDVTERNGFRIRALHGRHAELPKLSAARLSYMLSSPARRNIPYILREHLRCRENGETLFYQIEAEGRTLSLMGSLNLRPDIRYPTGADLLILPYNGWEDNFPPAVRIMERLRPKRAVLDHYDDTFPPVTMPIDLSPILRKYPETLTALEPGRAVEV